MNERADEEEMMMTETAGSTATRNAAIEVFAAEMAANFEEFHAALLREAGV